MLKRELGFRKIPHLIMLLFSVSVLVESVGSANGTVLRTYYPSDYNILNGTYLSGSVPASAQTVDSDYFIVRSSPSATSISGYNPSGYNLLGSTAYVSGAIGDLASDNGVYMVFRSYASATSTQTLYAHQETTTIGGNPYYLQKLGSAEATGTSLSASMAVTGRQLLGNFVYPLTGVSSIPSSTWTMYYRAWQDASPSIAFDAATSATLSPAATSISWSHTAGTDSNRLLLVAVSVHVNTGTPTTVSNVTYDGVPLTQVTTAIYSATNPQVRTYVFQLVNPTSGTKTVTVNFAAATLAVAGAITYANVDQTTPIQISNTTTSSGTAPSVSVTVTGSGRWLFGHLGGHRTAPPSAWTITEGAGQTNRWTQDGKDYKGRGSDKTVSAGSQSMSWTLNKVASYVATAVVINPATLVGHIDVDILIRQSDDTIRTTITTNAANSGDLTSTSTTLSGIYSWAAYTVVDQTDYLEIDYYVEVTTAVSGTAAYLRIDDDTLDPADQTKTTNIMLPNEYAIEVEFTGASNTYSWTQLVWTINSAWTTDAVTVALQLYNYTLGAYPISGNGFISYTSSATANTDETKTQTITTNPQHFRDASGNWKIKIKGVKTTTTQFDFKADWVKFEPTYWSEYTVSTEFLFSPMTTNTPTQLNFTVVSQFNIAGVGVTIQVWNYSASAYATSGEAYLTYTSSGTNETNLLSINTNPQFYTSNGNAKIKITGVLSTTTQYQQETNQVKLLYSHLGVNSPPVLDPIGSKTVDELTLLTFTATASDPDLDPLTFSLGADAPSGASITDTSTFTWTPAEAQGPGIYTIRIIVSDANLTDYEDITVTVNEVNSAPVLDPIGPKSVNELELLTFNAIATDSDIPAQTLTFSLGAGAPSGVSITGAGVFTWIPTEAQGPGNYTIRVVVSDGSLTDYEDISVNVYEVHIHDVAVINVTALPANVISGQVVSVTVIVENQGTATETFNVTIFYNETIIETNTVTNLAPGDQTTLEFAWNTTGLNEASYTIRAEASGVPDETDTNNNAYNAIVKVSTQTSSQPFDWFTTLLYVLPLAFMLLFILALILKRRKTTKTRIEKKSDTFTKLFGITHQQMIGKKMLLEIDPKSDYQNALFDFVSEARNSGEALFIFTGMNSALHSAISGTENVRFLLTSLKTSQIQQINEMETLLPAADLSVLLDAIVRVQKVQTDKTVNMLFDDLSGVILTCGFEKTYKFMHLLLEAISSPKTTALFVFNPTAHDPTISSSIRGLFQIHLAYTKRGPNVETLF